MSRERAGDFSTTFVFLSLFYFLGCKGGIFSHLLERSLQDGEIKKTVCNVSSFVQYIISFLWRAPG